MRLPPLLLLSALAVLAQDVTVEFDETVDFRTFHTFAVRGGQLSSRNPALNNDLVRKRITTGIERELTAKGLAVASGPPDLNVLYRLGSAPKAEVERYPAGWRGRGTRVVRVPVTEGTLVIDLRDRANQSLVWRALVTDSERNAAKIESKLDKMIKKAFEKYPPKGK